MDLTKAIISLRPGANWILRGEEYEGLEWLDENQTKPTKQELIDECNRLNLEYASMEYQRKRQSEYPSFAEQFDTLYHEGYDAWKASIDNIKNKYPKP
jgi:hypothetical protein